ncbi:hypothetical protein QE152_g1074 [Popillia japonica]|uniref:Uncharacterized protein n=1 Tax=Popillia japonica TaxID=7064 RepID=A0AAW1N669_POPJA
MCPLYEQHLLLRADYSRFLASLVTSISYHSDKIKTYDSILQYSRQSTIQVTLKFCSLNVACSAPENDKHHYILQDCLPLLFPTNTFYNPAETFHILANKHTESQ